MIDIVGDDFKLLIIIVKKDLSRKVIEACKRAGAEGGTAIHGKGTGTRDRGSFFGITVEPEKDIILCLAPDQILDKVISRVTDAARLDKPGTGVAFVINAKSICGISHLLDNHNDS